MKGRALMAAAGAMSLVGIAAALFFPFSPHAATHVQATPVSPSALPPTGGLPGDGLQVGLYLLAFGVLAVLLAGGIYLMARKRPDLR
jgi:hypothetical protein